MADQTNSIENSILSTASDLESRVAKVKQYLLAHAHEECFEFTPRQITDKDIIKLFGDVKINGSEAESMDVISQDGAFHCKLSSIKLEGTGAIELMSASNCDNDELFISSKPNKIDLINSNGTVLWSLNLDFAPESISLTPDKYLLMSQFKMQNIKFIRRSEGLVKDFLSTAPLGALGIFCEHNGSVLVCLVDSFTLAITKKSRRLVRRYSPQGTILNDIEYVGGERLFICPYRVVGLLSNRVFVLDITSRESGRLIVTSGTGDVIFRYNGDESGEFCPTDLCVDSYGYVFVAESNSNSLFILNPSGILMKKYSTFLVKKMTSLALAVNNMVAVAYDDKSISFFEFDHPKEQTGQETRQSENRESTSAMM